MPQYTVYHSCTLTESQRDALAKAITNAHCQTFQVIQFFVQVIFTDTTNEIRYIGGVRKTGTNHIIAQVRNSSARSQQQWNDLIKQVAQAWDEVVGKGAGKALHSCIMRADNIAGMECGMMKPGAGGDMKWLEENWEEIRRRAEEGEEEFEGVVRDAREGRLKINVPDAPQ